jgi:hypothetical protein
MAKYPHLSWLTALIIVIFACNGGSDTRQSATGVSSFQVKPGPGTAAGAATGGTVGGTTAGGTTADTTVGATGGATAGATAGGTGGATAGTGQLASTTQSTATASATGSKILSDCQATTPPTAWRPVVNGGSQPADCAGGTLVSWCPTRAVIEQEFPTLQATLETGNNGNNFSQFLDTQGLQIYAVSTDPANPANFVVHMAKISQATGATTYNTLEISGVVPTQPSQACATGQPITQISQLTTTNLTDGPQFMIYESYRVDAPGD